MHSPTTLAHDAQLERPLKDLRRLVVYEQGKISSKGLGSTSTAEVGNTNEVYSSPMPTDYQAPGSSSDSGTIRYAIEEEGYANRVTEGEHQEQVSDVIGRVCGGCIVTTLWPTTPRQHEGVQDKTWAIG